MPVVVGRRRAVPVTPAVARRGAGMVFTLTGVPTAPAKCAGRAQRALEPGARHLEGVVPGDRVVLVEGPGERAGERGDRVDVDAAGLVDGDPQHAAGVLEVVEIEMRDRPPGARRGRERAQVCSWSVTSLAGQRLRCRHPFRNGAGTGRDGSTKRKAWARPTPFVQNSNGLRRRSIADSPNWSTIVGARPRPGREPGAVPGRVSRSGRRRRRGRARRRTRAGRRRDARGSGP